MIVPIADISSGHCRDDALSVDRVNFVAGLHRSLSSLAAPGPVAPVLR
jgi:hypothetical protein